MKTFYLISILATVLLGILHSLVTFKVYIPFTIEAYWFFSAGLTLIFSGIANYMNYRTKTSLSFRCVLVINVLLAVFTVFLASFAAKPTIITTLAISGILLVSSVLHRRTVKKNGDLLSSQIKNTGNYG